MLRSFGRACCSLAAAFCFAQIAWSAPKPLEIFFVDVEGGQATLFVPPSGQALLVDTGWGYNGFRDANRIATVARMAKVKSIHAVVITHYHADHVGGVPQLVAKLPVDTFYDHGPNRETGNAAEHLVSEYQEAIAKSKHEVVKAGDTIPVKNLEVRVVSADGQVIHSPLAGGGQANAACSESGSKEPDPSENARSVGLAISFGDFHVVDLGDLTWNKERDLMCPNSPFGRTDLLVVSHHGLDQSNSPALIHGLKPRVAVMDNGSKKGGSPSAWDVIHSSPGLKDLWQLHFANAGGQEHNAADPYIANVDEADTGYWIRVTAREDGSFTVYNQRNKFSKNYPAP